MRKIRLIKKVIPELVAYMHYDGEKSPEYRCKECRIHIMDNYRYCPHCGSELDWEHEDKKSKEECRNKGKHYKKPTGAKTC